MRLRASGTSISVEKKFLCRQILPTVIASRSSRHICSCSCQTHTESVVTAVLACCAWSRKYLALVCRQPSETALLPLGQRDPVLDARRLERVQKVVALEGQIRLKDEYGLRVAEDRDAPNR